MDEIEIFEISHAEHLVYKCKLDPETKTTLQVYLYKNVRNVEKIRKNVINGSWKCAIIKPTLIIDPLQIAAAANKAVLSEKNDTMTTRSVFTEILFYLSLTKSISKSLSIFGVEKDTDMFICFLLKPGKDENCKEILSQIEGKPCKMSSLALMRNLQKIKSVYQLSGIQCDYSLRDMLNIIISRMATKNVITY